MGDISLKLEEIIQELYAQKFVEDEHIELSALSGGTVSQVYLMRKEGAPLQVLKANDPVSNELEIRFLQQYADCSLLPRVLFKDTHLRFFLQSFVDGTTRYVPGRKKQQLLTLTDQLLNTYTPMANPNGFGFEEELRPTWANFLNELVKSAKQMSNGFLTVEDDVIVSRALELIPEPERVYRIHGDCGAHNFFFGEDGELTAVIDPMPILGDPLYDLLFAYCSTPDDLTPETLTPALNRLNTGFKSGELIEPFILISLYIRLGRAPTHQPDQLQPYREAWNRWKERL